MHVTVINISSTLASCLLLQFNCSLFFPVFSVLLIPAFFFALLCCYCLFFFPFLSFSLKLEYSAAFLTVKMIFYCIYTLITKLLAIINYFYKEHSFPCTKVQASNHSLVSQNSKPLTPHVFLFIPLLLYCSLVVSAYFFQVSSTPY